MSLVAILGLIAFCVPRSTLSTPEPEPTRYTLPDGSVEEYTLDSSGRKHGVAREWYPDGTMKRETVFSHGSWQHVRAWWPNGTLQEESSVGFLGSTMQLWDEDGKPVMKLTR